MITVLIAEDMTPISKRYEAILSSDPEITVVANVATGKDAVQKALEFKPNVILMDVEMETRTAGLEASMKIIDSLPETKIIIITVYEDDETVFHAFQVGITDYFLKNSSSNEIIKCIKDAYMGISPIRPVIAQKIRREFQRVKNSEKSFLYVLQIMTQLSQTELDILNLMSKGYTRSMICETRCVELSTVKTHIHNILKKFEMNSMNEVIENVTELGVMDYFKAK